MSSSDGGSPATDPEESFTIEELASRSGIPLGLLHAEVRGDFSLTRLVRGGLLGLAVIGAAGWMLQRSMQEKEKKEGEESTSGPAAA